MKPTKPKNPSLSKQPSNELKKSLHVLKQHACEKENQTKLVTKLNNDISNYVPKDASQLLSIKLKNFILMSFLLNHLYFRYLQYSIDLISRSKYLTCYDIR